MSLVETFLYGHEGGRKLALYIGTKHSWKGKYKRIMSCSRTHLLTSNPTTFESTNSWPWTTMLDLYPEKKHADEFRFDVKEPSSKRSKQLHFSSDRFRPSLLTDMYMHWTNALISEGTYDSVAKLKNARKEFSATKFKRNNTRVGVVLRVTEYSLDELDQTTRGIRVRYFFKHIDAIAPLSDGPGAFVVYLNQTLCPSPPKVFQCDQRDPLLQLLNTNATTRIGIAIKQNPAVALNDVQHARLALHGSDEEERNVSVCEFDVSKVTTRHSRAVPRVFALTDERVVERDPRTYVIVTTQPLSAIVAIIRPPSDPQAFSIQYRSGIVRSYISAHRDTLLASLLDCSRAAGNRNAMVTSFPIDLGNRMVPLDAADTDIEVMYLKMMASSDVTGMTGEELRRVAEAFSANVPYQGASFSEKHAKLVSAFIANMMPPDMEHADEVDPQVVVAALQAVRRVIASRIGFEAFTQQPGVKSRLVACFHTALASHNEAVQHAAIEVASALLNPVFEAHLDSDIATEQLNKRELLADRELSVERLIQLCNDHSKAGTGALVLAGIVDLLNFVLCDPYSDTTDETTFDDVLNLVGPMNRNLFRLFNHRCLAVSKGAGMLMKAVITESSTVEMANSLQYAALVEGAVTKHFFNALFLGKKDTRQIVQRNLSRDLVRLWTASNDHCMRMFGRVLPVGLIKYLYVSDAPPADDAAVPEVGANRGINDAAAVRDKASFFISWRVKAELKRRAQMSKATVRRKKQQSGIIQSNWPMLFYQIMRDHSEHDLIWNHHTREELREALDVEIRNYAQDVEMSDGQVLSWNHIEFEVKYPSLSKEPRVADYYLRTLLEQGDRAQLADPADFFNELYHHFFQEPDVDARGMCLQCLALVYRNNHEVIGRFRDTPYIVRLLRETTDLCIRDRLLQFLSTLILVRDNAKQFVDAGAVRLLVDLLALVHLDNHKRASTPLQSNMIMASAEQVRALEKEWYYTAKAPDGGKAVQREGPHDMEEFKGFFSNGKVRATTRCWAQGMEDWMPLQDIPQLRWQLLATGAAVMDNTQMGCLILRMFVHLCSMYPSRDEDGGIIRPMPMVKRQLCERTCFPHLVQVLLTFDPNLVEHASNLLHMIIEDSIHVLPKLYLTGLFYFSLMYPGSNVVPVARLLKLTHKRQHYLEAEAKKSILGPVLPEAMVCFMSNYEPDKFSEIFLGNFDTPETIWDNEMRRRLIEKVSMHLGTFPLRLQTHTKATYAFVPIAPIVYPELEDELFCHIFYLRHLCNTEKFPEWPIANQVELMQTVLGEWKAEMEKKASSMSRDEAFQVLNLKPGTKHDEDVVRKAYYRMAAKYHPDKNPDGREMFEKVQKSYEMLATSAGAGGPDPNRLYLLMKAQVILYVRYPEEMQPFKYAGFPLLLKIIKTQTAAPDLFSQKIPLLDVASELAYMSVSTSPLNAEELRREGGVELLLQALGRCVDMLTPNSTAELLATQVSTHVVRTLTIMARFESCRAAVIQQPSIPRLVCRCMYFKAAPKLVEAAIHCSSEFSVTTDLQNLLIQSGALWHLVQFLFNYDYTLDEGGVEASADTNVQELANRHAKQSVLVVARLGGYLSGDLATPRHDLVRASLDAMLTPYQAAMFAREEPFTLLKSVTANVEMPFLIWDNGTRQELLSFIEKQLETLYKTGQHSPHSAPSFSFECLQNELKIGGVYIRVYNEQPKTVIPEPGTVLAAFMEYLTEERRAEIDGTGDRTKRLEHMKMVLVAVKNLLVQHHGAEAGLANVQAMTLLFSFLDIRDDSGVQHAALEAIAIATTNTKCVEAIAEAGVVPMLLPLLQTCPPLRVQLLKTVQKLVSSSKIVADAVSHGGVLYLLDVFCNADETGVRSQSAAVVARIAADKMHGPKFSITLAKFLPQTFLAVMREDADSAVATFDSNQENPELIWNDTTRSELQQHLARMSAEFASLKAENAANTWKMQEGSEVQFHELKGELVVGGVYIRLFLKQPNYALRNPRQFLVALFDRFLDEAARTGGGQTGVLSAATVAFLQAQSAQMDAAASTGHIAKFFPLLQHPLPDVRQATLHILHQLALSQPCVDNMGTVQPCIAPIMSCMKNTPEHLLLMAELLERMFRNNSDRNNLIPQAQSAQLCQAMLHMLDSGADVCDQPQSVKALFVKALKHMIADPTYGEQIDRFLDQSPIWATYKEQRHDFFLNTSEGKGLLTGPTTETLLLTGSQGQQQ